MASARVAAERRMADSLDYGSGSVGAPDSRVNGWNRHVVESPRGKAQREASGTWEDRNGTS